MFARLKKLFTKNNQKQSNSDFIKRKETERTNRLNSSAASSTPSSTQVVHDHSDQDFLTTMLILDAIDKSPADYASGNINPTLDSVSQVTENTSKTSDAWSSSSSSDSWSSSSSSSDSWSSSDSSSSSSWD